MSSRIAVRQAISVLIDAGKAPTAIVRELGCSRTLVYKDKKKKEKFGNDLSHTVTPRDKRS